MSALRAMHRHQAKNTFSNILSLPSIKGHHSNLNKNLGHNYQLKTVARQSLFFGRHQ